MSPATRSVLGRGLAVLGTFTPDRPEQTLRAIAQASGLPSATAYRLVAELVGWGALERVARGRYRVGMRLWEIGSLAPVARGLRDAALPVLQDLCAVTGYPVHLVVLDGTHALFLERLAGHTRLELRSQVGKRLPLHASGPGKVLLAHAPPDVLDAVLAGGLPRVASGTITDPGRLTAALAEIRRTGHCLSREEMTDGAASVAAPVVGPAGEVLAGISVVVPSDTENLALLVPAVRMAATAVSRSLFTEWERPLTPDRGGGHTPGP
ncbi:IclR family transcriptional regulator [Pseudonocardia petroleophila]|uniref:IclR family transcriptional regulator n=1 Tax=Pseudonocardia petroleophila TaxID=37331 RepID=UPI002102CCAB|nr:IclR family transcriptional regulator [Pseudonocardia petroleophila]